MPKQFYTEKDIEDLVKAGVMQLEVNDDVVLTSLAYEKAGSLGLKLTRDRPDNPPDAPVRPYVSRTQQPRPCAAGAAASPAPCATAPAGGTEGALHGRIKSAVHARLGKEIDPHLLDVIIKRVLDSTGVK